MTESSGPSAISASVPETVADDKLVELSVSEVNGTVYVSHEASKYEVGRILRQRFFGDDLQRAKQKKPVLEKSFEAFCRHKGLRVDFRSIKQWISASALMDELTDEGHVLNKLTVSHFVELGRLKSHEDIATWARKAQQECWPVRELKQRLQQRNVDDSPDATVKQLVKAIHSLSEVSDGDAACRKLLGISTYEAFDSDQLQELRKQIRLKTEKLRAAEQFLTEFKKRLSRFSFERELAEDPDLRGDIS